MAGASTSPAASHKAKQSSALGTLSAAPVDAAEIQVDVDLDDANSAVGEDNAASSVASVSSSILQYRTLHGRRYHSDATSAQYWYRAHPPCRAQRRYVEFADG